MKLAIISPRKRAVTETFIQSHFDFLEADIIHYYGGNFPTTVDEKPLLPLVSKPRQVLAKVHKYALESAPRAEELALLRSLQREKPDVILIEYGNIAAEIINVLEKVDIPFVVHYHGFDSSVYQVIEKFKEQYQRVFLKAHSLVVVSSKMNNDLLNIGAPKEKLKHICYGPYPVFGDIQVDRSHKRLLAVGRFVDKKAPHNTILAFHKVLSQHPDAILTLIGSGPLKRACEDIVKGLNLEKNVIFMGDQPSAIVAQELAQCRAFVQHSRIAENGDSEGTPLSILEAQLAGVPVISTIHAGIADVVVHGSTGLLVAENDIDGMATQINQVLSDVEYATNLGTAARARIQTNFTMEIYIQKLQAALKEASLSTQ
jgi:glycosyltransferase involved in cell wall biosynthesis